MTVDPGTAISVSDRFCRIFDMQSASHVFFLLGLNFNTLHDLLKVISLKAPCLSVCLSVHPLVSNLGRAGKQAVDFESMARL